MYRKLENLGAALLERLAPKAEASASAQGCWYACIAGYWHECCDGYGCDRSESPCG
ncbi:hypothetical protein [Streptomyces tailanensis]|uniref:hypothetical protein n=1 Tax=Streptomyces tailanensis TaxID=2569858 RepID=UPI00155B1D97|nr:hypothetical protein [Streptomyces tailanensis]